MSAFSSLVEDENALIRGCHTFFCTFHLLETGIPWESSLQITFILQSSKGPLWVSWDEVDRYWVPNQSSVAMFSVCPNAHMASDPSWRPTKSVFFYTPQGGKRCPKTDLPTKRYKKNYHCLLSPQVKGLRLLLGMGVFSL